MILESVRIYGGGHNKVVSLRRFYKKRLGNENLHHLIPRSRNGQGNEYNLFPWNKRAHSAYHSLFWNMTIVEVWNNLDAIHAKIFQSKKDYIVQDWIRVCRLEIGDVKRKKGFYNSKNNILVKFVAVKDFRERWVKCFGGSDIQQARQFLKKMMLYIVFGSRIVDGEYISNNGNNIRSDSIFVNGNMRDFLYKFPNYGVRYWAFNICFGRNPSICNIKSKIKKIKKSRNKLML